MIYKYKGKIPTIHESVFIADGAKIIGDVTIGKGSGIWFNTVLRGDEEKITIGERCNIQENVMCHLYEGSSLVMEDESSVGHNAIVHGCKIRKRALIGMGATVLDGADIGEGSIVGANSLVPAGKKIPPNSLVLGAPAKVIRELTEQDKEMIEETITTYARNAVEYQQTEYFEEISRTESVSS